MAIIENKFKILTELPGSTNLADFLIETANQITEQIAEHFKLNKETIKDLNTFNKDTAQASYNMSYHYVAKTIKYDDDIWLGIKFGMLLPSNNSNGKTALVNTIPFPGNSIAGIGFSSTTPLSNISDFNNRNFYKGLTLELSFLYSEDADFHSATVGTKYQTLIYDYCSINPDTQKINYIANISYLKDTNNKSLIFLNRNFKIKSNTYLVGGFLYSDLNVKYCIKPDMTIIDNVQSFSIYENYGVLSGNFDNLIQDNKTYALVLPCYICKLDGTDAYVYDNIINLYKAQGNFSPNQSYIIDGNMYFCIAATGNNALLLNQQISYEDWRKNNG